MRNSRFRILLGVSAAVLTVAAFTVTNTLARQPSTYSNSSLAGSYAVVGTGGANEAASIGITTFDGGGGASRSLILNEADPNSSSRLIIEIPATGNYTVGSDGIGTAIFVNELPDGSKIPFHFDFVITKAKRLGSHFSPVGTRLHMVQREPGIAAKLVTFDLYRLPE